ncbi:MAG: alpha/beta hydrolase [Clostridia bacterium]|nr:alpha/beta hydrolase [Clostridia bacterium]
MRFMEFGQKKNPAVMLLHGGGLSWWSFEPVIRLLEKDYFVVAPIVDGHGEDGGQPFISIEDSAEKALRYLDQSGAAPLLCLGGLSLGAQIAVQMLAKRPDVALHAVLESALCYPMPFAAALAPATYALCYGFIRQHWFSRLQAKALYLPKPMWKSYYKDSVQMTRETLVHIAQSNASYHAGPDLSRSCAKALIVAGEKELPIMKKSARRLSELIPDSRLWIAPGLHHGQWSLTQPGAYAEKLKSLCHY